MDVPFNDRLVVLHHLTADKLRLVLRLGGLPVPSLGITKAGSPFMQFGDITLIGTRRLAEPRDGPVYACDAFTAPAPRSCRGGLLAAVSADEAVKRMTSPAARKRRGLYNGKRLVADACGSFPNLEAIQSARARVTDPDTAHEAFARLDAMLDRFILGLAPFHHPVRFATPARRETFAMLALLTAFRHGGTTDALEEALWRRRFRRLPSRLLAIGSDILAAISTLPTAYFEAKPTRLVRLEEFAGAVLPQSAPPGLEASLRAKGLAVRLYDGNMGVAARISVVRALAMALARKAGDFLYPVTTARILFKRFRLFPVSRLLKASL